MSDPSSNPPSQKDAIAQAIALYGDKRPYAVADIGSQSGWLRALGHHPRNLYLSGPMGLATSVAIGLAACRPDDEVLAIAGDGALAMSLSSLVTIAGAQLRNLSVLVVDNQVYEFTASVPSPARDMDWRAIGAGVFGDERSFRLADLTSERWVRLARPAFIAARVQASPDKPPPLGFSPGEIRQSFLDALRRRDSTLD